MVVRIQGGPQEGLWFSANVVFAELVVTGATFETDLAGGDDGGIGDNPPVGDEVNSSLEIVLEAVNTRGTVIGVDLESETVVHLLIDYGQAYGSSGTDVGNQVATDVLAEVEALIDDDAALSNATFSNVGEGFRAGSGPD